MNLDRVFDDFQHTAFRLEQRPSYNVGGQEAVRLAAFRNRTARPERSVRTDPWLARIARTTVVDRKRWSRLRVVDTPLTDYQLFELLSGTYVENGTAGDQTFVVERAHAEPYLRYGHDRRMLGDFWLFDLGHPTELLVAQDYTDSGQPAGKRVVTDPAERDAAAAVAALATDAPGGAAPFGEYVAGIARGTRVA